MLKPGLDLHERLLYWGKLLHKTQVEYKYMIWDLNLKAPVSQIQTTDLNGLDAYILSLNLPALGDYIFVVDGRAYPFMDQNKAGRNGETLSWKETLELYS
jgi:hypothetical protein